MIRFAILNYTYGGNGESISSSIKDRMNMLCDVDESNGRIDFETLNKHVLLDISEAKTLADIVIVCPHWGTEYSTTPSKHPKKSLRMQMTEAEQILLLAHTPCLVQPVKWIEPQTEIGHYAIIRSETMCQHRKNGQRVCLKEWHG